MALDVKVAATGIIALCLALAALLYMSGITNPSVQSMADRFFGLAVVLSFVVILLALVGIKVRFP
jgi:hypothetical protein